MAPLIDSSTRCAHFKAVGETFRKVDTLSVPSHSPKV